MDLRFRFLNIAVKVARFLPMQVGYFLAGCGGDIFFLFSARHRNIISNNIKHILGVKLDKQSLRQKVRIVFKNMAKNYFELTKLPQLRSGKLGRSVKIEGWHHLIRAISSGKGTIIASVHLGNFEFAAQVLAMRGIKMTIIVEEFNSTPFLRCIAQLRQRNGNRILPLSASALRDCLQTLRHGGTVVIVCDRDIQGNGLKVKFFGEEASLPSGAISLALRTGATVVPLFCVRKPSNQLAICIESPLELVYSRNRSHSVRANLERFVAIMEDYIYQYPEQWVVREPIWHNQVATFNPTVCPSIPQA
ncbi:lysophospholipid acyltransferase family protein [Chloroflexota bacterium]